MRKWRAWLGRIQPVEVERETAKFVWVVGGTGHASQDAKVSKHASYHDTWEEAHARLLEDAERDVESARLQLERARGKRGQIKGMKKPEDA